MNLGELIETLTELILSHKQIVDVQIGNTFDVATSKSSDSYPACWLELPVLIDYNDSRKKTFSFALNFLSLCKSDDISDAVNKTSDMEIVCDEVLQAIKLRNMNIGIEDISGLTLRNFSDDDLVGVRAELTFYVGRECDINESFDIQV